MSPVFDETFRSHLSELFKWRRDVRHFRGDPVPPALLNELLDTAALAPSVGLSEPWRFVTVDNQERRDAVRACFESSNAEALASYSGERAQRYAALKLSGLVEAPCHVAVFADPNPEQGGGLGRLTMPETSAYSAVMAVHTLWLTARAAGLGLGWISILDPRQITAILDVPPEWIFIGYLCLGYPVAESDVPELEAVGWEQRSTLTRLSR
jgi:5,6-dimethylbenzimidazole synthase